MDVMEYKQALAAFGVELLNETVPTRTTCNSATLIDHVFSDIPEMKTLSRVEVETCSFFDHSAVVIELDFRRTDVKRNCYKTFSRINREMMEELVQVKLNELCHPTIEDFIKIIQTSKAACTKTTVKKVSVSSEPWININIIREMKKREKLFKKFKVSPNTLNVAKYKKQQKLVKNLIKQAKESLFEGLVQQSDSDPRRMWKAIKSI